MWEEVCNLVSNADINDTINVPASHECAYHFYPSSTHRNELPFCSKHFDLVKQDRVMDFNPLKLLRLN